MASVKTIEKVYLSTQNFCCQTTQLPSLHKTFDSL